MGSESNTHTQTNGNNGSQSVKCVYRNLQTQKSYYTRQRVKKLEQNWTYRTSIQIAKKMSEPKFKYFSISNIEKKKWKISVLFLMKMFTLYLFGFSIV